MQVRVFIYYIHLTQSDSSSQTMVIQALGQKLEAPSMSWHGSILGWHVLICSRFARNVIFFYENYGNPGVTLINFYAMWV